MRRALAPDLFSISTTDAGAAETASTEEPTKIAVVTWVAVSPVPLDASAPSFRHVKHGLPIKTWAYKDAEGRLLGYTVRFETAAGKEILPYTWCRSAHGAAAWRWRAMSAPRPLYRLDQLAQRPDAPVLVVEGEKTAEAAQCCFPDYVAITWPGGSGATAKADWSPLVGRRVILWPDADAAGLRAMDQVEHLLRTAGAANVSRVQLPEGLPAGWDLADELPAGMQVGELLAAAAPVAPPVEWPPGYFMTRRGLVWRDPFDDEKPEVLLAGPFSVVAETRDQDGTSWGVLLKWFDHDGRQHRLALPRSALAGDGAEARRLLLDGGLHVGSTRTARERLNALLTSVRSPGRMTATNRIGWHARSFVLPDECIGPPGSEPFLLQSITAPVHAFHHKGTIVEWQDQVARFAIGNSRLAVALSAAFAAALVDVCDAESGGVHFRGASSIGKTTALVVAGSVWGGNALGGYKRSWRATSNGLEGVALTHCDALLCLDELSQISSREAGEAAYLLANGSGKSRSARDGSGRPPAKWRCLFLSSGELGLADKVAEDGKGRSVTAGQHVRVVDIPADAGAGLGIFEELHGFASAEALSRHLTTAATAFYGLAARQFVRIIVSDLESLRSAVKQHSGNFIRRYVPEGTDGQVYRVAHRFALIGAAGELATAAGLLPWPAGEATKAAARVYHDWIDVRGGVEPAEVRAGISQVQAFLLAHGMSRFAPAWEEGGLAASVVRDLAGFRKREGDGWDFYVTTSAWSQELCRGLDGRAVARQLLDRGMLLASTSGKHRAKLISVPGHGRLRLYHLPSRLLEAAHD